MKRMLVAAVVLGCASAQAFDSRCQEASPDCEGEEAARRPWVVSEHGDLWLEARQLAALPEAIDAPFLVRTPVIAGGSLAAAPLDLATAVVERRIDIAVFAQLPDLSYTLWDWASGNEGCPPSGTDGFAECHAFRAHMGWLNSTHFLPQAEQVFTYLHRLAVERASSCRDMRGQLAGGGTEAENVLRACDREALLIEAQAHHYLQDAWSMGHMWQRWGSPELDDFAGAAQRTSASIKGIGDAVGRGSGIIHGAKAITGFDDAMCGPQPGVDFLHEGSVYNGAGDLFVGSLRNASNLVKQRDLMRGCLVSAMREVYEAGARSFGEPGEPLVPSVPLSSCFTQRATNRAIALGAAIQLPAAIEDLPVTISSIVLDAHVEFLTSIDIDPDETTTLFLPLTSDLLTRVNGVVERLEGEPLFAPEVLSRWHEDMRRIQGFLSRHATNEPFETYLADGDLGPLLGLEPNATYAGVPGYADPALPWDPVRSIAPIAPTIENAGNILARTFLEAHAAEWCAVLRPTGTDEFSISRLRDRCVNASPDEELAVCTICADVARFFVVDPDGLTDEPVCARLGGADQRIEFQAEGDESTAELAVRYCESGALGVFLDALRIVDQRNGTSEEAGITTPTALPHTVTAGPSTMAVERDGAHIVASLTTTSLPPALDGGYLEGLVGIFIGPGEASRVAFTRSATIPAPFGNLVNAIRFPGGTLDFGDPGLTIQEFQFELAGVVDFAEGEAVLFETGVEFQFHEEPVTLADAVLFDLELLPE